MKAPWRGLTLLISLLYLMPAQALYQKGIYLTQGTAGNRPKLMGLIQDAKAVGINTFIIDVARASPRLRKNIALIKSHHIHTVARIVIFPGGGTSTQVSNPNFWQRKYRLVQLALDYGMDEIQLDYIRYNTKRRASRKNVDNINQIIRWFKTRVHRAGGKLQIDVFGETSYKPSHNIGQDIRVFAPNIDVLCPMVYPSHYAPYRYHSYRPYRTVYDSLASIPRQFGGRPPFQVIPYLEVTNFRYRNIPGGSLNYIYQQIKAAKDARADGWYFWSARNHYRKLFNALAHYYVMPAPTRVFLPLADYGMRHHAT